ncbi:winged helix-turn-helix domain-containing protein [Clostridium sp. AL.422]|uniref:ArsR/SmtB family transcription factor n=1 Tax=Clostridium TaxID=1485 RepID=UPI00293DA960|nr:MULTISPECIES: winged helix-turn-helix domain-containing protein [unclassified Clostridium]MDV4150939.1 winged helix-turn-helix domain-containing protein [Clostridium sp. AL.422]
MNYIINDEVDILYEINRTFIYLANESEEIKKLNESLYKIDINNENYKRNNLKSFYKFIEKFKKLNTIPMDKIEYFFSDVNDGFTGSNLSIFEIFLTNFNIDELINLKEKIMNSSEEEVNRLSLEEIIRFIIENFDDKNLNLSMSKDEFIKYLISSKDFSYEAKWKLTVLLEDSKNHLLDYFNIFLDSIDNFQNAFTLFEQDKNKLISYLKNELNKDSNFLTELITFKLDEDTTLIIYPSMLDFRKISLSVNTSPIIPIKETSICYLGYKFQELMNLSKGKKDEEEILLERLKCISDKSKYEILKMLNNEPLYSQQIAQKLNLTTATISYHMNALALNKLVTINKIDNKGYYSINKEEINKICTLLQNTFN